LKTDKPQFQTLEWYIQVSYKHKTDIKRKKKKQKKTSITACKEHSVYKLQSDKNSGMESV